MSEDELLNNIRSCCDQDPPRQVYADWLDEVGQAACAAVVRAEIALNTAPADPACWERLHLARGAAIPRWLFHWEQPSLTRRVPMPLSDSWNFRLDPCPPGRRRYRDLPDLDEEASSWDWLAKLPRSAQIYQEDVDEEAFGELAERVTALGFVIPEDMTRFFLDCLPERRSIESALYASFVIHAETWGPAPLMGGLLVPFYNDSQSTWGVGAWLHRSGAQAVVHFSPAYEDEEPAGEVIRFNELVSATDFTFAAPSFSSFVYRYGMENQLWLAAHGRRAAAGLTPVEQRYLDRLGR